MERRRKQSPTLRCCVLTVAVTPVRMGNAKQEKPLAQCTIPLGHIDPANARSIMKQFMNGEEE